MGAKQHKKDKEESDQKQPDQKQPNQKQPDQKQPDQEQLHEEQFVLKDNDKPLDENIQYQLWRVSHSLGIVGDLYLRPQILGQIPKLQKWRIRDLRFSSIPRYGHNNMYLDQELSQFVGIQFRVLKSLNLNSISVIEPLTKLDAPNLQSIAISTTVNYPTLTIEKLYGRHIL